MSSSRRWFDLRSRRRFGVDSHDVRELRGIARRTLALRVVLASTAVLLVCAAAATARNPQTNEQALVPPDRVGMVVLDLSLSITDDDYTALRRALRRLIEEKSSIGLIVFSDAPYELLPPGTPAAELKPILRLLVAPRLGPVRNPWTQTFRAGTRISAAIDLARESLQRNQVASGSVVLVSDLETAPDDVPALAAAIGRLDQAGLKMRIVPLSPSSDALSLFTGLLPPGAFSGGVGATPDGKQAEAASVGTKTPETLLVLGLVLFAVLAVHEGLAGRIGLPRAPGAKGEAA